jgi:cytochrome c551
MMYWNKIGVVASALLGVLLYSPTAAVSADAGAALFKSKCAMCHGADGGGQTPMGKKLNIPPLGSEQVQKESDATLSAAIVKGKGKMKGVALQPDQVIDLLAFIRSLHK